MQLQSEDLLSIGTLHDKKTFSKKVTSCFIELVY